MIVGFQTTRLSFCRLSLVSSVENATPTPTGRKSLGKEKGRKKLKIVSPLPFLPPQSLPVGLSKELTAKRLGYHSHSNGFLFNFVCSSPVFSLWIQNNRCIHIGIGTGIPTDKVFILKQMVTEGHAVHYMRIVCSSRTCGSLCCVPGCNLSARYFSIILLYGCSFWV